jgi:hypothetical protein
MRTKGQVTISDAHCEAIQKEIGYRLRRELGNDHLNIPNWMLDLVKRRPFESHPALPRCIVRPARLVRLVSTGDMEIASTQAQRTH